MAINTYIANPVSQTITDGVTNKAPSENAVFDALAGKQYALVSGTNIKTINGTTLLGSGDLVVGGGLTIGTTAITSGTVNRILFEGAGNVVAQDSQLTFDGSNFQVQFAGATSGDVNVKFRNSGNTLNLFEQAGNGDVWMRNNAGTASFNWSGTQLNLNSSGTLIGNLLGYINISPSTYAQLSTAGGNFGLRASGNISFGGIPEDGTGSKSIIFNNGTAPSGTLTDKYYQYSADQTAGNACPHFRTENQDIIKIYSVGGWGTPTGTLTRTTFDESTVTLPQLAQRVAALITDLKTGHQLLKA